MTSHALVSMLKTAVQDPSAPEELFELLWSSRHDLKPDKRDTLLKLPHLPARIAEAALRDLAPEEHMTVLARPDVDAAAHLKTVPEHQLISYSERRWTLALPELTRRMRTRPTRRLATALLKRDSEVAWDQELAINTVGLIGSRGWRPDSISHAARAAIPYLRAEGVTAVLPRVRDLSLLAHLVTYPVGDSVRVECVRKSMRQLVMCLVDFTALNGEFSVAGSLLRDAYLSSGPSGRQQIVELVRTSRERRMYREAIQPIEGEPRHAAPNEWRAAEKSAPRTSTRRPAQTRQGIIDALLAPGTSVHRRHALARQLLRDAAPFDVDVVFPGDQVMARIWLDLFPSHQIRRHGLSVLGDDDTIVEALTRRARLLTSTDRAVLEAAADRGIPADLLRRLPASTLDIVNNASTQHTLTFILKDLHAHPGAWALYQALVETFPGTFDELITTCLDASR